MPNIYPDNSSRHWEMHTNSKNTPLNLVFRDMNNYGHFLFHMTSAVCTHTTLLLWAFTFCVHFTFVFQHAWLERGPCLEKTDPAVSERTVWNTTIDNSYISKAHFELVSHLQIWRVFWLENLHMTVSPWPRNTPWATTECLQTRPHPFLPFEYLQTFQGSFCTKLKFRKTTVEMYSSQNNDAQFTSTTQ